MSLSKMKITIDLLESQLESLKPIQELVENESRNGNPGMVLCQLHFHNHLDNRRGELVVHFIDGELSEELGNFLKRKKFEKAKHKAENTILNALRELEAETETDVTMSYNGLTVVIDKGWHDE